MRASVTPSTGLPMQSGQAAGSAHATSESLLKHAAALQAQAAELAAIITGVADQVDSALMTKDPAALAKGLIRARGQRKKFFPRGLFSEPAWDILLELYAAELAQQRVSVTRLCSAAGLPATTGLRWLSTLEAKGQVVRVADPLDARRSFVSLTDEGSRSMERFFNSIKNGPLNA